MWAEQLGFPFKSNSLNVFRICYAVNKENGWLKKYITLISMEWHECVLQETICNSRIPAEINKS